MEGIIFRLATLLILYHMMMLTSAETYYVTPSSNTPCPEGVPCFTLSQYANKPSNYFASNIALILLPGNHRLDSELSIQNILFLSVESNTTSHSITCYQSARFNFESIDVISMRGLVLFGCVNNNVTIVEEFTLEDCSLDGQGRNGTGLQLNEVSTANITRSSFSFNTGREIYDPLIQEIIQAGGTIIVINSTLGVTISDCIFQNNTVAGEDGLGYGGAVYALSSPIAIVNSTLNSNTVTGIGYGGAVYALSSPITIVNSSLNSNTVTGDYGGGGAGCADSSPITIANSILNSNTVTGEHGLASGGAVDARSSRVTILNSTLNSNTVTTAADYIVGAFGGAVYAFSSPITIVNSTLNNNTATDSVGGYGGAPTFGGAVCAGGSPNITIVNSTLNNNTVTGNFAGGGGAVYAGSSPNNITIVNSTLNSNTVRTGDHGSGGAVYAVLSSITIVCTFLNGNTVTAGDYGSGGAVYADSSPMIAIVNK